MSRAVAAIAVVAAGCTTGPQLVGAQPSWRGGGSPATGATGSAAGPAGVRTFAPAGPAARTYNAPLEAPPSGPVEAAVIAAVRDAATRAKLAAPVADARLFRACAELAAIMPATNVIDYPFVEFALQRNGIIEPAPHLYVWWGPLDPRSIVDQLAPDLASLLGTGGPARFGIGAVARRPDGTGAIVFALQDTAVALAELPRALPAGGSVVLDAVIDRRYREPEVFVTREDGRPEQLAITSPRADGFRLTFACGGHRGRQQLEISASDASGPSVLANFPVWCGTAPPDAATEVTGDDPPATTPEAAERYVLDAVNRDRAAAGLAVLAWDEPLAGVARGHSAEMHDRHEVAHVSPVTGSVGDRIHAAKIRTRLVLENVARAYSVRQLHQGLMSSPGHRFNLMSTEVNHIGIGVVFGAPVAGSREMFVTEVFSYVPPAIDGATALRTVRDKLAAARPKLGYQQALVAPAQLYAGARASGMAHDRAYQQLRPQLDAYYKQYARVSLLVVPTDDVAHLDLAAQLGSLDGDEYGVAVAQGPDPD
ncbi:MAG TPA: CAP domain-containing protein, partial [Kofleriaceae bacterium]